MGPKIFFNELDDRRMKLSNEESILKSKIDGMLILKKDLKNFEVESNLEEVRWVSFILNSAH